MTGGASGGTSAFHRQGVYFLHGPEFLEIAFSAAARCKTDQFSREATNAQIMSAVAAEAFINQVTQSLADLRLHGKAAGLARIGEVLETLEVSNVQVVEKYRIASLLIPGGALSLGAEPLQSFQKLIQLRNSLVHPRAQVGPPKWFSYFEKNHLTVQGASDPSRLPDWRRQLRSKKCAEWACQTAARSIWNIIERLQEPCREDVPGIYELLARMWASFRPQVPLNRVPTRRK